VEEVFPVPHPITGLPAHVRFKIRLGGAAERLRFKVYSRAMILSESVQVAGSFSPGWNSVLLPLPELPGGTWFCLVEAENRGDKSPRAKPIRLVVLR
jgi:hypothetical protein